MAIDYSDLFSSGVNAAGLFNQIGRVQDIGELAVNRTAELGDTARAETQFKPFSVASSTGNVQASPQGDLSATLDPALQGIVDTTRQGSQSLFEQAQIDPSTRQGAIFDSIMASMAPQQERERLALEGRQFAQGRGGIRSNMYGGTPEQLAMAKAQEEARLGAAFTARQQGLAEQAQQGALGGQMLDASLRPEAALFNQLSPAIQTAQLGQTGQLAGSDTASQLNLAGLEGQINAEKLASDLYGGLFRSAASAAGSLGGAVNDAGGLSDFLRDLF